MRRKLTINFFNMIEVVLAMAIIAFGMTSILGLFPVGLNALNKSIAENYCAESVENLMGYIKSFAEETPANYDNLITNANSIHEVLNATTLIPHVSPAKTWAEIDDVSTNFVDWFKDSSHNLDTGAFARVITGANLPFFRPNQADAKSNFVYFIVKGADNPSSREKDFSAMIVMRKAYVNNCKYPTGDPDDPLTYPWLDYDPASYAKFGAIIFEVSWPLEKKYAEREKRYYYMLVSRPN